MEAQETSKTVSVEKLYRLYSGRILNFVQSRISNLEEAENITQDVWIRILENETPITEETALPYLYKVAGNLVNDYLRKLYVRSESRQEIERRYEERIAVTPLQEYIAQEIARFETFRVERLPAQRRMIYKMSRYEDMAVADISEKLSLSFRTVENHLRMGRRDVRSFISAIA